LSSEHGVCVVTGAAGIIGSAVSRCAAQRNYAVCVHYHSHGAEAEKIAAQIQRDGGHAIAVQADITQEDQVVALFRHVDNAFGRVTGLVNNAAAVERRPFLDVDAALLRRLLDVNLTGGFLCAREAAARMAISRGGPGGSIVNISSAATRTGGDQLSSYVMTKGGIESLTVALSKELGRDGIRVNTISPGIIGTEQTPIEESEKLSRAKASVPLGRLGTPDEVAQAIVWLLSDESSYVNGANIPVAGGRW
jgi:NAD(P)-dependent dehydrogenase (short-subunit alcohol dehydrogenase family)